MLTEHPILIFSLPEKWAQRCSRYLWLVRAFMGYVLFPAVLIAVLLLLRGRITMVETFGWLLSTSLNLGFLFLPIAVPYAACMVLELGTGKFHDRTVSLTEKQCLKGIALVPLSAIYFSWIWIFGVQIVIGYYAASDAYAVEAVVQPDRRRIGFTRGSILYLDKATRQKFRLRHPGLRESLTVGDEVCLTGRRWIDGLFFVDGYELIRDMEQRGERCLW